MEVWAVVLVLHVWAPGFQLHLRQHFVQITFEICTMFMENGNPSSNSNHRVTCLQNSLTVMANGFNNTGNWILMNLNPCTYHCFGHHSSYVFSTIHLQNALFKGLKYYQTWMIPCTFAHLIMSKIFMMQHTFFRCFDTNMCNITNTRLGIYLVQRVLA